MEQRAGFLGEFGEPSTGKIVPVSLFAHMKRHDRDLVRQRGAIGVDVEPAELVDADDNEPWRGQSSPDAAQSDRTAGCSTALVMISLRPGMASSAERIAALSPSVPPEV